MTCQLLSQKYNIVVVQLRNMKSEGQLEDTDQDMLDDRLVSVDELKQLL